MKKSEFKKLVKEYIKEHYGFTKYKCVYINIDDSILGYVAYCVITINSAIVYSLTIFSDIEKSNIQHTELKVVYL